MGNGYQGNRGGSYQPPQQSFAPRGNSGNMPTRPWVEGLNRSLFKNMDDLRDVQRTLMTLLQGGLRHLTWLTPDDDGLYSLEDTVRALRDESTDMQYVGVLHLAELYLRDKNGEIILNEKSIGHIRSSQVPPPDLLFFGTTTVIADRAIRRGIVRGAKPMVSLSTTRDGAMDLGRRFANIKEGEPAVLEVEAGRAYSDGVDFSASGEPGALLCDYISHRYIVAIHYADGTREELTPSV